MKFSVIDGWGRLPEGWTYREVAGVAVDKQDRAFVFTRGEHPVIVFDRDGNFLRSWGEGVVRRAHGITIDADEMVWLTDDLHHTVRKFTPDGKLLLTIGDPDRPAELQGGKPFNRPTHVAICAVMPLGKPVRQLSTLSRKPVAQFATRERFDGPRL